MNNFLLRNTDFFCEPPVPFPSNCMQHGINSSYADLIQNNLLLGPNHFQETNTYMEETSINPSNSCITANSSSSFAFQPSFDDPFLFTPKKDLNFYYENLDQQAPTFQTIPSSYYIANNELALSLGSQLSEPSCSNLSHVTGFESSQPTFHKPDNCSHVKSKYLQVVQQILSEVTSYVLADTACAFNGPSIQPVRSGRAISGVDSSEMLGLEEEAGSVTCADVDMEGNFVQQEINASRAELLRMLQLVCGFTRVALSLLCTVPMQTNSGRILLQFMIGTIDVTRCMVGYQYVLL